MPTLKCRWAAAAGAAFLLAASAGCGPDVAAQVAAMNKSNIQRLANIYSAHQNFKGGRGPADEAEFKTFIKEFDPAKLKMMAIDPNNMDALFTSERDNQPFAIRYGVGGGRGSEDPVVFEQEGKEGKKQVGYTGKAQVETVDETTYASLWAGQKAAPAAGPATDGRPVGKPVGAPTGPPGK
jgi:hypothetical protein